MKNFKIIGYSDNDFSNDVEDKKSTMRQVFFLDGITITRNILKPKVVVLLSYEAEYIAITSILCQGVWRARLMKELMGDEIDLVKIMIDNQSTIILRKNSVHHNKTRHINTCDHFI